MCNFECCGKEERLKYDEETSYLKKERERKWMAEDNK